MPSSRLLFPLCYILMIGLALVACGQAGTPSPAPEQSPAAGVTEVIRTAELAAREAVAGQKLSGTVTILGTWDGSELDSFLAMVKPFQDVTGVSVLFNGTRDLGAVLRKRVRNGNPPDLAGLPGPGYMAEFMRRGELADLSSEVLDTSVLVGQYAPEWIALGTVDGKLGGIFIRASVKGLIWYNPKVWENEGFEIPETWDELMNLSREMAEGGSSPWCIGLESGAASGWPGTDWIEEIVLRQQGSQFYDQWYQGKIAWTSPEIKQAWETWGEIVSDPEMVYGGPSVMLSTNFSDAGDPLFTDPPGCYMHHQASFITEFFEQNNPEVEPGEDFNFFRFPAFDSHSRKQLIVAGDLFGMFNDTPEARALMRYLATPEAQAVWVKRGGMISPNRRVRLEVYPDPLSRKIAELLVAPENTIRFDASDLMPGIMNNAFWKAILNYVEEPQNLDKILQNLDAVRKDAYKK